MRIKVLALAVLAAGCWAASTTTTATAHIHQSGPMVFWSSTYCETIYTWNGCRPCGLGTALISDGNQNKGFFRATTTSRQRDIAFGSDCQLQLKKQAGQIKAKGYYYVLRNGSWAYCDATALISNGTATYQVSPYIDYTYRPCGRAYYRTFGYHKLWGHGCCGTDWHDSYTPPTDKHWFG